MVEIQREESDWNKCVVQMKTETPDNKWGHSENPRSRNVVRIVESSSTTSIHRIAGEVQMRGRSKSPTHVIRWLSPAF
jgi:hypothetical protein